MLVVQAILDVSAPGGLMALESERARVIEGVARRFGLPAHAWVSENCIDASQLRLELTNDALAKEEIERELVELDERFAQALGRNFKNRPPHEHGLLAHFALDRTHFNRVHSQLTIQYLRLGIDTSQKT